MSELLKNNRGQTKREPDAAGDAETPLRPGAAPERQRATRRPSAATISLFAVAH